MRRFVRFAGVGLAGAAIQVAVFTLLVRGMHLPAAVSAAVAVELAVLHNFVWHERFTWRDRAAAGVVWRLWRFHLGNGLVSLAGNTLLAWCLVGQWKAPALPAAALSIAICAPLNFVTADRWVFRGDPNSPDTPESLSLPRSACRDGSYAGEHKSATGTR